MDDTTKVLLGVLRSHFEQARQLDEAWQRAPEITLMHLCRPGWPGESLGGDQKKILLKQFKSLAAPLSFSSDMKSLLRYAQQTIAVLLKSTALCSKTELEKRKLLAMIKAEQLEGRDPKAAAMKAAARYLEQKRRAHRGTIFVEPNQHKRLLEILALPKSIGAELPKEDIRGLILNSSLSKLLEKASCFEPELLKATLGRELYEYFKPVGFADRKHQVLLAEVPTASISHELSFRKPELLKRLARIAEFAFLKDIRFTVSN